MEGKRREEEIRERFLKVYEQLKSEVLQDPAFEYCPVSSHWLQQMLDYNVPGGKLSRGLSVVETFRLLKQEEELSETHFFLASVLGWCIQWFVACALMLDDVLDNSVVRRGRTCWFRLPNVGMIAINDVILLWNHINRILRNHFRNQPYYADLLDLFNEVEFQTTSGEMLDLLTTVEGAKDLSKFTLEQQQRISRFKTAYGTFYLPLSCALLMLGQKLDDYTNVKDILLDMGIYFQVQDNYGKEDSTNVDIVKSLYNDLNLQGVFAEYEIEVYEKLMNRIETIPSESVQSVLKSFLSKIYRRNK
ncbi:farnesyl pyrophosphate synthase 1-like isoform X2 [Silene latifolia]|uniref:farnesyl pyrophosphate synthase 1-like isoform X2 n=1 Tax=Silene latifolia TaxID=37657 RepID=UPI003D784A64